MRFGSVTPVYNEEDFIGGFLDLMDVEAKIVVMATKTFQGNSPPRDRSEEIALEKGALVIKVDTSDQILMRNIGLRCLHGMGIDYAFTADVDEYYPKQTLENLKQFVTDNPQEAYSAVMPVSFRKPNWIVEEMHNDGICICFRTDVHMPRIRYNDSFIKFPKDLGHIFHLSYARKPEKIKEKMENFSHAKEVVPGWYENVFLPCTPESKNLHPTVPESWPSLRVIELPEEISSKLPKTIWNPQSA